MQSLRHDSRPYGAKPFDCSKALEELQQESASLQTLERGLTPEERARVKTLIGAIQLVLRALKAL